jgi:glutamate synthase (NADPH/NADH)
MQTSLRRVRTARHAVRPSWLRTKVTRARGGNPGGISAYPAKQGLYDPIFEKDSCGVGFVANIKGVANNKILTDGRDMMERMEHRGATGEDPNTGDGAGILLGLPDSFLRLAAKKDCGIDLPPKGKYVAGNVFLNPDRSSSEVAKTTFEEIAANLKLEVLGWRSLPTNNSALGDAALATEPIVEQVFVRSVKDISESELERKAYMLNKRVSNLIRGTSADGEQASVFSGGDSGSYGADANATGSRFTAWDQYFYICSLSGRTMTYKGQLTCEQVFLYYNDLTSPDMESHLCLVHSRFSTNTFPSWDRAQPLRMLAHNGEINTVTGNKNWMQAREGIMQSDIMSAEEMDSLFPCIDASGSDSASFDDVIQFLTHTTDKTLHEILFMMAPEAWENSTTIKPELKGFYRWAANLMEPWDGPALLACCDGRYVGARLDRNGLRPSRWYEMSDDTIFVASEVGVIDVPDELVVRKGRLEAGTMILVDTEKGLIMENDELQNVVASKNPYREWVDTQAVHMKDLLTTSRYAGTAATVAKSGAVPTSDVIQDMWSPLAEDRRLPAFGYHMEHLHTLLVPSVTVGMEPLGSMGNDAPLAALSDNPRLLFEFFKQHFAQVTNPPIDPIREAVVMDLRSPIGPAGNLLKENASDCRRLNIDMPVLTNAELETLATRPRQAGVQKPLGHLEFIDTTFPRDSGTKGMLRALGRVYGEVEAAIKRGAGFVALSDRLVDEERVPIPALLVGGAVHQELVRDRLRMSVGLISDTGEARETHHHAALVGMGMDAVCPYMVYDIIHKLHNEGGLPEGMNHEKAVGNYLKAMDKGIRKIMAKIGISTMQGYKGAQIFEAVGISQEVTDQCFTGIASRIGGGGYDAIATGALKRHEMAFPSRDTWEVPVLQNPGDYHWRDGGEKHINDPTAIAALQASVKMEGYAATAAYKQFSEAQREAIAKCTIRGLLQMRFPPRGGIPLEEVEPASEIVKRFATGAMSYGSISMESHASLAVAMNRLGGKSNTGEGGEEAVRYTGDMRSGSLNPAFFTPGDSERSSIKQVASGRFGVTIEYLTNADEIQIKMAQGAKPGEGGELPGFKVNAGIAKCRQSTPGVGLISPPPHHDIYSIEDLSQLILDLKMANPSARISVKLVSKAGVGTIAAGVAKAKAEHILISGHDGGTGASTWTGIKHCGLPWELGLAETHQTLVLNNLRGRAVVQTDGQLRTGRDVVVAAMLGAEEFGFATAPLIAMGCIMMRKCHLNTCPVGIATQDEALRKKFEGQPEHVVNYLTAVAEEARGYMARLGFRTVNEMIGRTEQLQPGPAARRRGIELSGLLLPAHKMRENVATYQCEPQVIFSLLLGAVAAHLVRFAIPDPALCLNICCSAGMGPSSQDYGSD